MLRASLRGRQLSTAVSLKIRYFIRLIDRKIDDFEKIHCKKHWYKFELSVFIKKSLYRPE
jgi:hypothetical protein